jgi:hypothetical protein
LKQATLEQEKDRLMNLTNSSDLTKLLDCITFARCGDGKNGDWFNLAQAIKNSFGEEGKELFVKFTRDAFENGVGTYNKCEEADTQYDTIKTDPEIEKPLGKGSLHYWAKEDNSRLYQEHFPILNKVLQEQSTEDLSHPPPVGFLVPLFSGCSDPHPEGSP